MDYRIFYDAFIVEAPQRANSNNDFDMQKAKLDDIIQHDNVVSLPNNLYKIKQDATLTTYWAGSADGKVALMIVDVDALDGRFCKVVLASKNPNYTNKEPYASDVYVGIMQDQAPHNLILSSDSILSDNAHNIWKRILDAGHVLSVWDTQSHTYAINDIQSPEELDRYFGNADYARYRYIMSESQEWYRGLRHSIAIMEIKRHAGYPLTEMFSKFKKKDK